MSRYHFIQEHQKQFPVGRLCALLAVSRSGCYEWRDRPESGRARSNQALLTEIEQAYERSRGIYGAPRVYHQLNASGVACGRHRVARLMRQAGLQGRRRRKTTHTTDSRHRFPVAENVLDRQFQVERLDSVWLSDITYVPTDEGWLYVAAVMDLASRKIVGWSMQETLERVIVLDAFQMALKARHPGKGLLIHTDQGVQYASGDTQPRLSAAGITPSMSRKGQCWDNAPLESFFASLKTELIHHRHYATRAQARREIFDYIEVFYNRQRLHSGLGYRSPVQYEAQRLAQVA